MMMKPNPVHRYLPAIGLVSVFYGINILLGLGRDSLLAAKFGATEQLDALLLGLNFARTLGISLALAVAGVLIPVFSPLILAHDSRSVLNLSCRWLGASMIALIPLSLLLAYFASPVAKLLGPGLNEAGLGASVFGRPLTGSHPKDGHLGQSAAAKPVGSMHATDHLATVAVPNISRKHHPWFSNLDTAFSSR